MINNTLIIKAKSEFPKSIKISWYWKVFESGKYILPKRNLNCNLYTWEIFEVDSRKPDTKTEKYQFTNVFK